jgi:hypothetical protein
MSGIKDSNVLELDGIINNEAIQNDKLGELASIDASVVPPSDYKYYSKLMFENSDSDSGTMSTVTKPGKPDKHEEEEYSESMSSRTMAFSDREESEESSVVIKDPLLMAGSGTVDFDRPVSKKKTKDDHTTILKEIAEYKSRLMKRKVDIPNFKDRDVAKSKSYAAEIRDVLKDLSDDNKTADSLEGTLRFLLNVLCRTFVGGQELFGWRIDLRGYNTLVMSEIGDLREDVVDVAAKVRKTVGRLPMKLFLMFKIFVVNFGMTIYMNNSQNEEHHFDDDFSDTDEESDYESESEASDDESNSA